ncbi:hypothetical protein CB0940_02398 [Cercospora beticola]|uniref:Rhodopsin domain-containing protein n=1 Tax=Cercospora beticola TaxID=122368 RepID=A0A2G5I4W2_CERBT|nr:hypothetical protein CB0940_02398 [Cercospora beticola]PIA99847.1 hypothetical protein CB0940_02398 [Cercospora beticola]WPA99534.1 hypothetical protein RHO25_004152 [Cercospora beticola]
MSSPVDLSTTAAMPAPEGYTANLENPVTQHRDAGVVLAILGMVVSTAFLSLRIYTRAFASRRWGIDDAAIVVAWMLSISLQAILIYLWATELISVHLWDLSLSQAKESLPLTTISAGALYIFTMAIAKLSLLVYYHKLSPSRWFRYLIYAIGTLIIVYSTALFFAVIFACKPVDMSWDLTIRVGKCLDKDAIYLGHAGLNTGTTLLLFGIPVPMILKLEIPRMQKIGLASMLFVGVLTLIASIVRLALLPAAIHSADATWSISKPAIWLCIETNLVIICGCLPSMRSFFRHVAPKYVGERYDDDYEKSLTGDRISGGAAASSLTLDEMAKLNRLSKSQPKIFTSFEAWQSWWEKDVEGNKNANRKSLSKRASQDYILDEKNGQRVSRARGKTFSAITEEQDHHDGRKRALSAASKGTVSTVTRPLTARSQKSSMSLRTNYSGTTVGSVIYEKTSAAVPPRPIQPRMRSDTHTTMPQSVGLGIYGYQSAQTTEQSPRVSNERK